MHWVIFLKIYPIFTFYVLQERLILGTLEEDVEEGINFKEEEFPSMDFTNYGVRIGNNLHQRITKHINMLKYLEDPCKTRQTWITQAIKEKLDSEEKLGPEGIPSDRFLNIKLSSELNHKIERRVDIIKKIRISFSKKLWLLEAIYEKLDRDETETKKLLAKKFSE